MSTPTIDKIPFKITLPALVSVVLIALAISAAFLKLQMEITVANVGIANILEKIEDGNDQSQVFINELKNHETRISRLEGKGGQLVK